MVDNMDLGFRVGGGILSIAWAGIHTILGLDLMRIMSLAVVGYFFLIDAVLSIVIAIILLIGFKPLFIPALAFWWANYLLLTESRVFPAPVLGFPLHTYNPYVVVAFILDILLIIIVTALCIHRR